MNESFLHEWEVLIGSALGPFLAIILSLLAYFMKRVYEKWKDKREAIRRAEISFTQTINHILTSVEQLDYFVDRVKLIIEAIKNITDEKSYALNGTNFPPVINIHFDEELLKLKFKSYYLHNKILIIEYIVRWTNNTISQFREDFLGFLKKNEFVVTCGVPPKLQREGYVQNLEEFIKEVEKFIKTLKEKNVKTIVQAKVYNLKLMEKYLRTIWKYERGHFKYFKTKKKMLKYAKKLEMPDVIDNLIEKEVIGLINESEEKAKKKMQ